MFHFTQYWPSRGERVSSSWKKRTKFFMLHYFLVSLHFLIFLIFYISYVFISPILSEQGREGVKEDEENTILFRNFPSMFFLQYSVTFPFVAR